MKPGTLLHVAIVFGSLSLLSIGGGNSILPQMHLDAVNEYGWVNARQFADLFAISQAAPGPSILIVTLIGYAAGGVIGALVATAAMIIPAALLVYFTARFWNAAREAKWRQAVEKGFAPLTVGLVLASGIIVAKSADHGFRQWALTAVATVIFTCTKTNPLIVVGIAGVIGWLGWV